MASEALPLLVFPTPATADRNALPPGRGAVRSPDIGRQRDRLGPQLAVLQQAIDAERLKLQQTAPMENPELVLVLEIAGTLKDFHNAVARISGLEFLAEWAEDQIAPDDDFFLEDKDGTHKSFPGRLFLLGPISKPSRNYSDCGTPTVILPFLAAARSGGTRQP
jgi:hypothetical protein